MSALFFFLLISLQYFFTYKWLRAKEYDLFILLQLYSLFSYDFVFIHAMYVLPDWLVLILKPYNEYLLLYFICNFLFILKRKFTSADRADRYIWVLLLLPCVSVVLLNDLLRHINLAASIIGMRMYLLPILLPYMMYRCDVFKRFQPSAVTSVILILSFLSGIHGWIQKLLFFGNIRTLWFYDFFTHDNYNPLDYQVANYIRNGMLRVTSIYVSPLIYAIMLSVPIFLIFSVMIYAGTRSTRNARIASGLLLVFFLLCQWTTATRTAFIIDAIGMTVLIICRMRRRWLSYNALLLIPLVVVAATFATLLSGATTEASALGRIDQYRSFFKYFSLWGIGFNHRYVLSYFDSFFLSLALLFGGFVFFVLLLFYKLGAAAYRSFRVKAHYFNMALIATTVSFVYTFTFQFVAGTAPYKLYFILLFLILAHVEATERIKLQAAGHRTLPD